MPMKTTLSCQFCGSLIEICSQNFQTVTEDELWLLQANLYLRGKEKIPSIVKKIQKNENPIY